MSRVPITLVLLALATAVAAEPSAETATWWEQRRERPDIRFSHEAHREALDELGDPCMRCHPFTGTDVTDTERLQRMTPIANEPLVAICHECHVTRPGDAPSECRLCHPDTAAIRPPDHGPDYDRRHGTDGHLDPDACRECHLELSFCTDCHFRRDRGTHRVHGAAYRTAHGLEARLSAWHCASCHGERFCTDCHAGKGR